MARVHVLVLRSPGINCDQEAVFAWQLAGADVELLHVNRLIEHPASLHEAQILTIPGGFSYGDDISAGRIFASRLVHHLLDDLRGFVDRGNLILGICNGFQILVKAGLLGAPEFIPGPRAPDFNRGTSSRALDINRGSASRSPDFNRGTAPQVTLTLNSSGHFEDRWVHVEACTDRCPLLEHGDRFYVPVAHAEGRLAVENDRSLSDLKSQGFVALRYVSPEGGPAAYPDNPNGSVDAIAGLIDPTGRILGLMPHPERHVDPTQHPLWTRRPTAPYDAATPDGNGLRVFQRGVRFFQ